MSSPKIVCKSGYLRSTRHFFNILDYSGNKIAIQRVIYSNGRTKDVDPDQRIRLDPVEESLTAGIGIVFKDGSSHVISYRDYAEKTVCRRDSIRVDEVVEVESSRQGDRIQPQAVPEPGAPRSAAELDFFRYLSYTGERPGVQREDGFGLFGVTPDGTGNIATQAAKELGERYEASRKWSHIISLPTEDAKAAGYDNRTAWRDLILSKAPELAKAYNISLKNLVLHCAYHDNTDNPHVHLLMYSTDPTEGFVKGGTAGMQKATERVKSVLAGEIYRSYRQTLTKEKDRLRKELSQDLAERLSKMDIPPKMVLDYKRLGDCSLTLPGKREYGYLPAPVKTLTDQLLQDLFFLPEMAPSFQLLCDVQRQLIGQYTTQEQPLDARMEEFKRNFFHPDKGRAYYHNLLLRSALEAARAHCVPPSGRTAEKAERKPATNLPPMSRRKRLFSSAAEQIPVGSPRQSPEYYASTSLLRSICRLLVLQARHDAAAQKSDQEPGLRQKKQFRRKTAFGAEEIIQNE